MKYRLLALIITIGIIARCVHLLDEYYYVLSADSYLFHYIADSVQSGTKSVIFSGYLHTGIAYPVGYLARITGLYTASCLVPLAIHVLMSLILFWFTSRHWGKLAGYTSVLIWALIPQASLITAAGYLDRDGLSVLIMTSSIVILYESWVKGGIWQIAGVTFIGVLLLAQWVQWLWIGPLLMILVISVISMSLIITRMKRGGGINMSRYAVILVIGMLILGIALKFIGFGHVNIWRSGDINIGENTPLRVLEPFVWWSWAMASLIAGVYLSAKRRYECDIVILAWFGVFIGLSFISNRCGVFALPAVCIFSGVAIDWLVGKFREIDNHDQLNTMWQYRACLAVSVVALVAASIWSIANVQNTIRYSPDHNWQGALDYLRGETPDNAKIAVYGDYGYWVMDWGRLPSSYSSPNMNIDMLACIYTADKPNEIIDQMNALNCTYFICSKWDFEGPAFESMVNSVFPGKSIFYLENNSLVRQVLYGEIPGIDDLEICYRNTSVVILTKQTTDTPQYTAAN